jgi:site-specific DNA recombinase
VRVALYARVSTEAQEARGTIGSQLELLRARAADAGHEVVVEFPDNGYSGARLDRPGLDALRDAAEAGLFEAVLCLTPDRLARAYAYQFLVLEELARHGVRVLFSDAPPLDDDPQARLLIQMQGVIAEYERARIAERYRRGKLYRARAGEAIFWKVPYGYRRVPRGTEGPAHHVVHEPEAAVVRRIFDDYVAGGYSIRQIVWRLHDEGILSPSGKSVWGHSTVSRLLHNRAYVGTVFYNRTEAVPVSGPGRKLTRQRPRSEEEWIPISVPAIIDDRVFEAAQRVTRDNSKFSPRRSQPGAWLLRGLVVCGSCGVGCNCHKMRGRNGAFHRYYYCRNHDALRAGGGERRCPERNIRADELDEFVFEQVREALLRPDVLLAGEAALANRGPAPDDELLGLQLQRLDRKLQHLNDERRRLVDIYQAGLLELAELQRRASEVEARRRQHQSERENLIEQRQQLAQDNRLRLRVAAFAERVRESLDGLDVDQRQRLLRLIVDEVRVSGWQVEIRLRIPLDAGGPDSPPRSGSGKPGEPPASSNVRLRSLRGDRGRVVQDARGQDPRRPAAPGPGPASGGAGRALTGSPPTVIQVVEGGPPWPPARTLSWP